jgi:RNA-directed DNA polymerase
MNLNPELKKQVRDAVAGITHIEDFGNLLQSLIPFAFKTNSSVAGMRINSELLASLTENQAEFYRQFIIPKANGGARIIHAPKFPLKYIQKVLSVFLNCLYEPHFSAMGYIDKRSILSNALLHLHKKHVYNIDLKDFFTGISSSKVDSVLKSLLKVTGVTDENIASEISGIISELCCLNGSLPQGAPSSPIMSNIACDTLDIKLSTYAQGLNATYSRYADDITFSSDFNIFDTSFKAGLTELIGEELFKINPAKDRMQPYFTRQQVTGLIVNDKANVQRKFIKQVRFWLFLWRKFGYEAANQRYREDKNFGKRKSRFENSLLGRINYIGFIRGKEDFYYLDFKEQFIALMELKMVPLNDQQNNYAENLQYITGKDCHYLTPHTKPGNAETLLKTDKKKLKVKISKKVAVDTNTRLSEWLGIYNSLQTSKDDEINPDIVFAKDSVECLGDENNPLVTYVKENNKWVRKVEPVNSVVTKGVTKNADAIITAMEIVDGEEVDLVVAEIDMQNFKKITSGVNGFEVQDISPNDFFLNGKFQHQKFENFILEHFRYKMNNSEESKAILKELKKDENSTVYEFLQEQQKGNEENPMFIPYVTLKGLLTREEYRTMEDEATGRIYTRLLNHLAFNMIQAKVALSKLATDELELSHKDFLNDVYQFAKSAWLQLPEGYETDIRYIGYLNITDDSVPLDSTDLGVTPFTYYTTKEGKILTDAEYKGFKNQDELIPVTANTTFYRSIKEGVYHVVIGEVINEDGSTLSSEDVSKIEGFVYRDLYKKLTGEDKDVYSSSFGKFFPPDYGGDFRMASGLKDNPRDITLLIPYGGKLIPTRVTATEILDDQRFTLLKARMDEVTVEGFEKNQYREKVMLLNVRNGKDNLIIPVKLDYKKGQVRVTGDIRFVHFDQNEGVFKRTPGKARDVERLIFSIPANHPMFRDSRSFSMKAFQRAIIDSMVNRKENFHKDSTTPFAKAVQGKKLKPFVESLFGKNPNTDLKFFHHVPAPYELLNPRWVSKGTAKTISRSTLRTNTNAENPLNVEIVKPVGSIQAFTPPSIDFVKIAKEKEAIINELIKKKQENESTTGKKRIPKKRF